MNVQNQPNLLWLGELKEPYDPKQFAAFVEKQLNRSVLLEITCDKPIKKIAWCTGAAQDYIGYAIEQGCDVYLTGEVSERTIHIARENQIHFIAAGHHATERYGVQALGQHLAETFSLDYLFIDIDNPA